MTGHIFIYGEIGKGLGKVSIESVKSQLDPKASDYILHMASPGGDVFEGFGIYNILRNSGKKIVTHIEAVTASIATLVSFAGETIVMNRTAQFMIHNPYISDLKGEAKDLRNVADQLDQIKALLMDVASKRATRNGKSISNDELSKLYDNETWLNSDTAMEYGFVDEVQDAIKAVAKVDLTSIRKMEKETWLQSVIKNLFGNKKFKNEFTETLQDGTTIIVMSEDGDWAGKQVVTQQGEALPPGDYTLASGKVITVGENSTISEVKEAAAAENKEEDMSQIKELQEKLAAAEQAKAQVEAQLAESQQAVQTATAKFENRIKDLETKFKADEDEKKKIVGQPPIINKGPVDKSSGQGQADPMGDFALNFYKTRNIVNNG